MADPNDALGEAGNVLASEAPVLRPAAPGEGSEAAEARGAREAMARLPRRRAVIGTQEPVAAPPATGNPFDRFDDGAQDDGVAVMERRRLNRQDAYYRGSLAGSTRLATLAHWYKTEDPPEASDETKAVLKDMREEYVRVVADLGAYDQMKEWSSSLEGIVALTGQLEGTMVSPESWIGWGAKGATWLGRTAAAGMQQTVIQLATDPVVQGLNMEAGVQKEYDPLRTMMAAAVGFGIGAGGHALGEAAGHILGQRQLRQTLTELAQEDQAFQDARMAGWMLDPENGIRVPQGPGYSPSLGEIRDSLTAQARAREVLPSIEPAAVERLPEVREGYVRMYHGGEGADSGGERHVSPSYNYARDYRGGPNEVWYVDVPADSPWLMQLDMSGTGMPAVYQNSIAPAEIMAGAKRVADGRVKIEEPDVQGAIDFGDRVKTEAEALALRDRYGRLPAYWEDVARRRLFQKEVGDDLDGVLAEWGFTQNDALEVYQHYDRQAGQTPRDGLVEALDRWVEDETAKAIKSIDGVDSQWRKDLDLLVDELKVGAPAAEGIRYTGFNRGWAGRGGGFSTDVRLPGFMGSRVPRVPISEEIPFGQGTAAAVAPRPEVPAGPGGGAPARGAAEPQAAGTAEQVGAGAGDVGRPVGERPADQPGTGAPEATGGSIPRIDKEQADRLRQRMTPEDREEFDRLVKSEANSDQATGADVRRLLELRLKYTPFAERAQRFESVEGVERWLTNRLEGDGLRFVEDEALQHMVAEVARLGGDLRSVLRNALTARYEGMKGKTILGQPIDAGTIQGLITRDMANLQERLMKTVQEAPAPQIEGPKASTEPPRLTTDEIDALKRRMTPEDREDFEMLLAMGANTGQSASGDTKRLNALVEKYREGSAPELKTEMTDQGEQTLIPGVEPVTEKERIAVDLGRDGGLFATPEQRTAAERERGRAEAEALDRKARERAREADAKAQGDLLGREIPPEGEASAIEQRRKGGKMAGEPSRPYGVPSAPGRSPEKQVATISLQQQSLKLAEALDIPVRQGRVTMRNAAGQFNWVSGVARVLEVPDFDVVIHEIGHGIEQKAGVDLSNMIRMWGGELGPLDYDPAAARPREGFAEVVRWMVTNPAYAARSAPGFFPEFRNFLATKHPDVLRELDAAAVAYRNYLDASSIDAVRSVVQHTTVDLVPRAQEMAKEVIDAELPVTIKSMIQTGYRALLDDKAPMTEFVRAIGTSMRERTGRPMDLKAADNPSILLRLFERTSQAALRDMMDGVYRYHQVSPTGPSLADAITLATGEPSVWGKWDEGKRKDFSAYLVAKRAVYLWDKFDRGELPNPPVAFSRGDAQQAMYDLRAQHPNIDQASIMVHDYTRELLTKAYEGGLLTKERFDKLLEEDFYVPFMRDVRDKPISGTGMGAGAEGPGTTEIVRRMRGSSRDILDPIESIMGQTLMIERTLAHNDIVKSMVALSQKAFGEGGKYVEKVRSHEARMYVADLEQAIKDRARQIGMPADDAKDLIAQLGQIDGEDITGRYFQMERAAAKGEPIVFYREGGELRAARITAEGEGIGLYDLLMKAPEPVRDVWANLVSLAATVKRASITTNPTFMVANYIRDQMAAGILRSDYVPFFHGVRGMIEEARQGESARLYGFAGGVSGGASVGPVHHAVERDVNAMAKKGYLVNRLTSLQGVMELASFTEAGTRNSIFGTVYEQGKRKGLSDWEAMVEAAFQAQDLLDFSRHGSKTLWLRNFLPFFNAHLQGLDKAYRTMVEPLMRNKVFTRDTAEFNNALLAWTKAGGVGGALGAIYAAVMSDSEAYRDADPRTKGTHLVVPIGNRVLVVPKPFELGMGFTLGEFAVQRLKDDDPRAFRMFLEAAWDTMKPPNPIADMPIVTPAIELATGVSLFTGRDIVPQQLARLPVEQQFNDRTSELGKAIGKMIGVSPIKVDYAIGSQFATWGRDVMSLSQGVSENTPAAALDDMVFMRRFVKDPTRSSDITTKFWEYMGQTTGKFQQAVAGYNDLVKEAFVRGMPASAAEDFLRKLPSAQQAYVILRSGGDDDGKAAFKAPERRLHPLQHAYDAVTILNTLRKELATNAVVSYGGQRVNLAPEERRLLLDNVRELAQLEMRNALVITGEGGYANRPVLPPEDTMAKIEAISPTVAKEIATRYATGKIYKTEVIQRFWPQLRDRLVQDGTEARISGLAAEAAATGWEFDGTRVRRPGVFRQPIAPRP